MIELETVPDLLPGVALLRKVRPETVPVSAESLVLVRLGERCNQTCRMCTNTLRPEVQAFPTDELVRRVEHVASLGFRRIVLTGGEPTLRAGFLTLLEVAQRLGLSVDVHTHGRWFARPGRAAQVRALGLGRAVVSLHSHLPEVNAQVTGAPAAAHADVVRGVQELAEAGVDVIVNHVVSTLNVASLVDYAAFCADRFGPRVGVKVCFPSLESRGRGWEPTRLPLTAARGPVRRFLAECRARGLRFYLESFPGCVSGDPEIPDTSRLGFGETHYLDDRDGNSVYSIAWVDSLVKVYGPQCRTCTALDRCCGVGRRYAEIHGVGELEPLADPAVPWWAR